MKKEELVKEFDNVKISNSEKTKIFKYICDLLELSDDEYANKIGDYYTSLTTDKRFILLDSAEWDLKDKHKVDIVLDEEDDEDDFFEEELEEDEEENLGESVEVTDDEIDLDDNDDMEDLTIVDDDELEEDE